MDGIRIGVVGVGHLGSLHAKMLSEISGVTFVGVHDIDAVKAQKVAKEFNTEAFQNFDTLLQCSDALVIATPTTAHFTIASAAIGRGKHLFIEKPITETIDEAGELVRMARDKNIVVQVGHIERFNPAILALEGHEFNPMFIESHRLAQFNPRGTDVAVVLDLMIHDIDLILSFVHSPVVRIDASGVAVVSDSVDIANARIQFENGCVANVTASRISQRKMRKMRLFQRNEYISIDFSEGLAEVFRLIEPDAHVEGTIILGELGVGSKKGKIVYEQPEVKEVNALKYELESFARSVRSNIPPLVTAEDGKRALEVAETIMKKISQQKFV